LTFPIFAKVNKNSFGISDLWEWLTYTGTKKLEKNWNKFLISREGLIVNRYMPDVPPYKIENDI